jgi:hypothetical protein
LWGTLRGPAAAKTTGFATRDVAISRGQGREGMMSFRR